MGLVDTHFHLDLHKNAIEISELIEKSRIYTIAVTNTPSVFEYTDKLCKNKKFIRSALGLHPELISKRKHELPLFKQLIKKTKYIGEIGLDFSNSNENERKVQSVVFKQIIYWCSSEKNKILSVHSRKAEKEVIDNIGNSFQGKVILHYYSGPLKQLERAIDAGFYFSINHSMTKTKNGRSIISRMPIDKLLTETDAPFVSFGNNSIEQLKETIKNISQIINLDPKNTEEQIFVNFKRVLTSH
ncbi:MAG: Qat anti-phage system TatD family nuclease QatD [Bacteroidales bacterium]